MMNPDNFDATNRCLHGTIKPVCRLPLHTQEAVVIPRGPYNNNIKGNKDPISHAEKEFIRIHECFRQELMPEVKAYRERCNQSVSHL